MPFPLIPIILAGLSAAGGALSNRSQTQQSSNTSTGFSSGESSGSTFPIFDSGAGTLRDRIIDQYLASIGNPATAPNDISGYSARVSSDINKLRSNQARNTEELLASRGVTGPAAATALRGVENQRFGDLVNLKRELPMLERDMFFQDQNFRQQLLDKAGAFFSTIPYGTSSTASQTQNTSSTGTGTQQIPGNMLGGLLSNPAQMLAFLYGQGAFGNQTPRRSTIYSPMG